MGHFSLLQGHFWIREKKFIILLVTNSFKDEVNPYLTEGVGKELRCVIKCALSNSHEVLLKR